MRRRLGAPFALVGGDHGGRVDRQPLVGVHRDAEEAGVGLRKSTLSTFLLPAAHRRWTHIDHPGRVASAQVVQHGRLIEVRQHGHVLDPVVLGGVHLLDVPILHCQGLSASRRGNISPQRPSSPQPSGKR